MADRHWVSPVAANWDGTAGVKWSATAGGVGGASVPGPGDNVFLDASSPANCAVTASATCLNFDASGFTHTFSGSSPLAVSGTFRWGTTIGAGRTYTGNITFNAAAGTNNIQSDGVGYASVLAFTGAATFSFVDALNTTKSVTASAGTLNTNAKAFTCTTFDGTGAAVVFDNSTVGLTGTGTIFRCGSISHSDTGAVYNVSNASATGRTMTTTGPASIAQVNVTAGTGNFTLTSGSVIRGLNFTGFTGAWVANSVSVYNNFTTDAGMTVNASAGILITLLGPFSGVGNATFKTNGCSIARTVVIDAGTGGVVMGDALSMPSTISLQVLSGTFDDASKNLNIGFFSFSNSNPRTINQGTGNTWTLTGKSAANDVWLATNTTNCTFNRGTCTIKMTDSTVTDKNFRGGGLSYYKVIVGGTGIGQFVLLGGGNWGTISIENPPHTVQFQSGTGVPIQLDSPPTFSGVPGSVNSLVSSAPGASWFLNCLAGNIVQDYLNIQDSHVGGGARWFAGRHSTNVSNNYGWRFTGLYLSPVGVLSFTRDIPYSVVMLMGQSNPVGRADIADLVPLSLADPFPACQYSYHVSGVSPPVKSLIDLQPIGTNNGPELTLGRQLVAAGIRRPWIIKFAISGSSLAEDWLTGANYLSQAIAFVQSEVAKVRRVEFLPMVWEQGEADAGVLVDALAYQSNLGILVPALRGAFGSNLGFVFNLLNIACNQPYTTEVRAGETAYYLSDPRSARPNFDGLPIDINNHYQNTAAQTCGDIFSTNVIALR